VKNTYKIPSEERMRTAYHQGAEAVVKVFQELSEVSSNTDDARGGIRRPVGKK